MGEEGRNCFREEQLLNPQAAAGAFWRLEGLPSVLLLEIPPPPHSHALCLALEEGRAETPHRFEKRWMSGVGQSR